MVAIRLVVLVCLIVSQQTPAGWVSSNKTIAAAEAKMLLSEALLMVDDALKKNPKYWEAAVYKSLVVRTQAKYETDPAVVKKLIAEADRLRAQAEALRPK